jgi:uncharacterized protein (TIGR00369 family)
MKIINPYNTLAEHHCFGCSNRNPIGLNLTFELEGERVKTSWIPTKNYQGFENIVHGGIISTLMDEVAAWAVQLLLKTSGVTSELNVKYLKPLRVSKGAVEVSAEIDSVEGKLAHVKTVIKDSDDIICAEGLITYFIFPEAVAKKKFRYPGINAFLGNT